MFLNSTYNSALNLDELKSQINLSLEDLIYTKDNGFAKGITNIFIKTLEELGPNKRPIHSDLKKTAFYIRNDNNWIEDIEHNKINAAIDDVAQAQNTGVRRTQPIASKAENTFPNQIPPPPVMSSNREPMPPNVFIELIPLSNAFGPNI